MCMCMYVCSTVYVYCESFFRLFQALVVDVDKQKFVRRVSTIIVTH